MIRVLLADDQALVREGFRALIDREDDMAVVGEAADGAEAIRMARQLGPDLVLMDIRMPGIDGLEATRQLLTGTNSGLRVLILTTFDQDNYLYEALKAGASGYLLKDVRQNQLIAAIHTVTSGDALLAQSVTRRLIESFCRRPPPPTAQPPARPADQPRDRRPHLDGARLIQRRDRGSNLRQREHGQDPRRARAQQGWGQRPTPSSHRGLRVRAHRTRHRQRPTRTIPNLTVVGIGDRAHLAPERRPWTLTASRSPRSIR